MNIVDLQGWSFGAVLALFAVSAAIIGVAGTKMTTVADRLADVTGLGEAIFGAVLLGGSTSLGGIVTSLVTAYQNFPELALSNAIGNVAAQTTILALADIAYRRANLEHAAASLGNLMQGALLVVLLGIPLLAIGSPGIAYFGMHPLSIVLVVAYIYGMRLVREAQSEALWEAQQTEETRQDVPEEEEASASTQRKLWLWFALLAVVVSVAGYGIAQSAMAIAERTGLSETVVGGILTAVTTASPELVTSIAAVRTGALTLAVGGIIGGNTFDIMIVSLADFAYRGGSIYHAAGDQQVFFLALTLILNGVLLLGLLRREEEGMANIGFESVLMLVLYFSAMLLLFVA